MTIAELLVKEGRWPTIHGPTRKGVRIVPVAKLTIRDLVAICRRLGLKVDFGLDPKEAEHG